MSEKSTRRDDKSPSYYEGARRDFVELLPPSRESRILEIGCGSGGTGALALEAGRCGSYVGIELVPEVAAAARARLTEVIQANVESAELNLEPESFDVLIASEVLEHLVDPWAALARLRPALKPGALVLASSPNIANKKIILKLLKGRFDYAEAGVMDRTHLRWFTPDSYKALFEEAGYRVEDSWPIKRPNLGQRIASLFLPNGQRTFWSQICIRARRT